MSENYFAELAKVNVKAHVEKKGQFSYLSWPFAVQELGKIDHTATWEVKRFDGMPFCKTDCGYFVEVAVTCKGVIKSQIHPVLDARNKPIQQPTAFDINTSIQRCLVKAIALHGLGLYIYAGEDLPEGAEELAQAGAGGTITPTSGVWESFPLDYQTWLSDLADEARAYLVQGNVAGACKHLDSANLETEAKVAIWTRFDSKERAAMKKYRDSLKTSKEPA